MNEYFYIDEQGNLDFMVKVISKQKPKPGKTYPIKEYAGSGLWLQPVFCEVTYGRLSKMVYIGKREIKVCE